MKNKYIYLGLIGAVLLGIGDWLLGFVNATAPTAEAFAYIRAGHAAEDYSLMRPTLAMALGAIGALFYYPCFVHMGDIVTDEKKRKSLNFLFGLSSFSLTLIHNFYAIIVFVYAWMMRNGGEALAGDLSMAMDGAMDKGVMVGFLALGAAQIVLFLRIMKGQTIFPRQAVIFHPLVWLIVFTLIGTVLVSGNAFTYGLYTFGTNGGMIIWLVAVLVLSRELAS